MLRKLQLLPAIHRRSNRSPRPLLSLSLSIPLQAANHPKKEEQSHGFRFDQKEGHSFLLLLSTHTNLLKHEKTDVESDQKGRVLARGLRLDPTREKSDGEGGASFKLFTQHPTTIFLCVVLILLFCPRTAGFRSQASGSRNGRLRLRRCDLAPF